MKKLIISYKGYWILPYNGYFIATARKQPAYIYNYSTLAEALEAIDNMRREVV